MHLTKRLLDAHVHGSKVRMRRHNTDNTAGGRIQARGNNPENPVSRSAIAVLHFERNIAPCDGCGRHFAGIYSLEKHCEYKLV